MRTRWKSICNWTEIVADSSAEAETAEQSRLTKTAIWVRIVLHFLDRAVVGAILLLCDNEATVKAVTKEGMSQRTRYFERATVLVRYAVLKLIVVVQWVATTAMMADFFTKASDEETYVRCRAVIMNIEEDRKWFPSTRTSVKLKTQRLMAAITRAVREMD